MENDRLPESFQAPGYMSTSAVIFFYEFLGTFCLVGVINATKGDAAAIGLTLFFLLLLAGPITGAHFNPAVTLGVWINRLRTTKNLASHTAQAVIMIAAQVSGAVVGMYCFLQILDELNGEAVLNKSDFPHLRPKPGKGWGQAQLIEMFCTFIFVMGNLLVKDERAKQFSAQVGTHVVGFFGCAIIALTLTSMILFSGKHTGASINPAVSVSQTVLAAQILGEKGYQRNLWTIYIMGPTIGGAAAGICSWMHATNLRDYGPKTPQELEDERVGLLKKNNDNDNEKGGKSAE